MLVVWAIQPVQSPLTSTTESLRPLWGTSANVEVPASVQDCKVLLGTMTVAVDLAAFPLFLRNSSFTGSFTLTPWYGLDVGASDTTVQKKKHTHHEHT